MTQNNAAATACLMSIVNCVSSDGTLGVTSKINIAVSRYSIDKTLKYLLYTWTRQKENFRFGAFFEDEFIQKFPCLMSLCMMVIMVFHYISQQGERNLLIKQPSSSTIDSTVVATERGIKTMSKNTMWF